MSMYWSEFSMMLAAMSAMERFGFLIFLANAAGTNEGSCKILALARLHDLTQSQTLALFGRYYRDDVLGNPTGSDHANIRNFMQTGWNGVQFDGQALTAR